MKKEEQLKTIGKNKLIHTLLSLESEEAKVAVDNLIESNNYYTFYESRITNIGLDFIDESFGAPLEQDVCKDVVIELIEQISDKITKSKDGCILLIQLYLRQSLILPYAPLLEEYFDKQFPVLFSKYAKKWKNRKALIKLLYKTAVERGGILIMPLLKNNENFLSIDEFNKLNDKLCHSQFRNECVDTIIECCNEELQTLKEIN
ncbi:MAG: hypothetical protein JJE21_03035 [Spirochaetaceae bacterium]|nr:hypothetical protein [Spirochaetaceae bacterium]